MDLKKGELKEILIEKIVYGGEGLGYIDGFAIFVPMSVPGDRVIVEIISLKKTYGRALIKEILEKGEERVSSSSITFEEFHSCDFGMLNYPAQLKYKSEMVKDVMTKIGKQVDLDVTPILGAEDPYHYRNKVIEPFSFVDGAVITGFFKRKTHDVFEVEENFLNSELGNTIIKEMKNILNSSDKKLSVYDEKTHKGVLRHIMVRTNSFGEAMVVLIVNAQKDNPIIL
ncbi:MAG: class I SAM-dependent RNA methyltransferase, partial [Fusobacteriaceae bacterium]|nr:class I SAM-dependent RNA methyltransferase [Fusobacteriaceae bacterium]